MSIRKHTVKLTDEEVKQLKKMHSKSTSRTIQGRIQILLLLDTAHNDGMISYETIGKKSGTSLSTVRKVVNDFSKGGLQLVLKIHRNPKSNTAKLKVDKSLETKIMRIARGLPPGGQSRWSLRVLADICSEEFSEPLSKDTIRRILKRKSFSLKEIPIAASLPRNMGKGHEYFKIYVPKKPDKVKKINKLKKKILDCLKKGSIDKKNLSFTIKVLSDCVNEIFPLKKLSGNWEEEDQNNVVLGREVFIRNFLMPIGYECFEYLDSLGALGELGALYQKSLDKYLNSIKSKTKDLNKKKSQYDNLCNEYENNSSIGTAYDADFFIKAHNLSHDIDKLEKSIERIKLSLPDIGDFIKIDKDNEITEVDRCYYSKKKKSIDASQFYTVREYWKTMNAEIRRIFPEINWNRMFQCHEEDYSLHIPIEDWWWHSTSSQPPIEKLYYALIDRGLMYNVSLNSFIRIFSYPIDLNWWHPIIWVGTYKKDKESSGNIGMLWCLISAMRKWDWFQEYCDFRRNPESFPTRSTSEILTQEDKEKISKFFLYSSGEIINPKSLKFSKDCNPSLYYIEELIMGLF